MTYHNWFTYLTTVSVIEGAARIGAYAPGFLKDLQGIAQARYLMRYNQPQNGGAGKIIGNIDGLNQAERKMVNDLLSQGKTVEIIPRNPKTQTFDFKIDGVSTELKTLQNPNINTGITRIQDGFKQNNPSSVVIDTRGTGLTPTQAQEMINRAAGTFDNKTLPGSVQVWTDQGIVIGGK
jgi:hypothetical protein